MADDYRTVNKMRGQVTLEDMSLLVSLLRGVQAKWKQFGIALGVDYDTIQTIEHKPMQSGVNEKMIDVLHKYAQKRGAKKWQDIVNALQNIENYDLASRIPQEGNVPVEDPDYIHLLMDKYRLKEEASKWKMFGLHLGVSVHELEGVDEGHSVKNCLMELLERWILGPKKKGVATIQDVIDACEAVDECRLAEELSSNEKVKNIMKR